MASFDDPVIDLPQAYYYAIGEFLFRYAQLEYQMHEIIWHALDINYKEGRILTIGRDAAALCTTIRTITGPGQGIWVKEKARIQEINYIANNASSLYTMRNSIAHGSWQAPNGNGTKARLHYMKQAEERILPRYDPKMNDKLIQTKCGLLRTLNLRAEKLIDLLKSERPSLQKKS